MRNRMHKSGHIFLESFRVLVRGSGALRSGMAHRRLSQALMNDEADAQGSTSPSEVALSG
jgi:hypothetical protein